MARILFAAAGDGLGHAVRAHAVGVGLLGRGHDVRFLSSHRTVEYLRPYFADRLHAVFGLKTWYQQNRAEVLLTVWENIRRAWREGGPALASVRELFDSFEPELVITDFEPLSAYMALRRGVRYISLDNQHLLTHCRVAKPEGFFKDKLSAYATIRFFYCGARRYLIPTFIPAQVRYGPASIVDPILRVQVYRRKAREEGFLLLYKSAGDEEESLISTLLTLSGVEIRAYGFAQRGSEGNVRFRGLDADAFLDDLASCRGVIASAGHGLISECLYFRKPMLLMPLAGHFEQQLNAYHVERMGAGWCTREELRPSLLRRFWEELEGIRGGMRGLATPRLGQVLDAIERELPRSMRIVESAEGVDSKLAAA